MGEFGQALTLAIRLVAGADPELVGIVTLSLRVSLTAAIFALLIGAPLGACLAVTRFPGRMASIVISNALLGLPPVVVGLAVYLLFSRSGPFGPFGLLFTPQVMIVAQTVLATPIVIALTHRALEPLWLEYGDALRMDGASTWRMARELTLIARTAMLTVFFAAFGRSIAEVGAILVVGGNIRGVTRTMTTAIALETQKGDLPLALALGAILIGISLCVATLGFVISRGPVSR